MNKERKVVWFEEVGKEDLPQVGGKGANLGEMVNYWDDPFYVIEYLKKQELATKVKVFYIGTVEGFKVKRIEIDGEPKHATLNYVRNFTKIATHLFTAWLHS